MKTFCTLLLLGAVTYVNASHHPCDPLAANTYKKGDEAPDKHNQVIPLDAFLHVKEGTYFVTHATQSTVPRSDAFCNAATHGEQCGAVKYYRKILAGPNPGSEVGADKLKFSTIFVGASGTNRNAIEYHMEMVGINSDDYIIQAAAGSKITAYEVDPTGGKKLLPGIPSDIERILRSEYALFHSEPGKFSVYSTCDGLNLWVSYGLKAVQDKTYDKPDPQLELVLNDLKRHAMEKNGNIEPKLLKVTTEINPDFVKGVPIAPDASASTSK